jgi:tetratricopeptide (TPR) repeat protein
LNCCCIELQAQNAQENFKFAKFNFDNGKFQESLGFLDKALKQDPQYVSAYYLRAEVYYHLNQFYSTISDINQIFKIETKPTAFTGNYYLTRGKAFLGLKDLDNAAEDFKIAESTLKNDAEIYYYKAMLEHERGNFVDALTSLEHAIDITSDDPEFYAFRAEIKMQQMNPAPDSEDYQSILGDINVALALDPDNYTYYSLRSNFLNSMGENEEAMRDYNKMIELSPNTEDAYTSRGVLKMNKYDYRSAALDFTKSILINPNDERNYRYRGLCYNNLNNFSEAYRDFTKSIDLLTKELSVTSQKDIVQNTLAETYILRGHCLNLMGNNAQACRDFLSAHNLGIKKGLNYYRKYCGIY